MNQVSELCNFLDNNGGIRIETEVSHMSAGSCPVMLNISYDSILSTSDTITSDVNY